MAIHASADVASSARVDPTANVWHLVFVGPGAILTNDRHPRAILPRGDLKTTDDWDPVGVMCETGAVVHDVADFALVAGVPARRIGWVGRAGRPLTEVGDGWWRCEQTGDRYRQESDRLIECVDDPGPTELDRP